VKYTLIALFLASGFSIVQGAVPGTQPKMSWWTREALATQSPRVRIDKFKHDRLVRPGNRVVADKHTINAYVPYGK
jgi:hypothetical protein